MSDLFDAAAMYDEDYLYFFAAAGGSTGDAARGLTVDCVAGDMRRIPWGAGLTAVTGYGEDNRPLTADHRRLVVVADLLGRDDSDRGAR